MVLIRHRVEGAGRRRPRPQCRACRQVETIGFHPDFLSTRSEQSYNTVSSNVGRMCVPELAGFNLFTRAEVVLFDVQRLIEQPAADQQLVRNVLDVNQIGAIDAVNG